MKNSINAQFEAKMVEFATNAKSALQEMTKMVLVDIALSLVDKSPVGEPSTWLNQPAPKWYKPGTFKNNWQLGVDTIPSGVLAGQDISGNISVDRMAMAIPRWPVGHTYYFVNNLPYANALEHGHSMQAPKGMVALTALEYQTIVEDVQMRHASGERAATKRIQS